MVYVALHNDYAEEFQPSTTLPEDRCGEIAVERLLKGNRGHYGPLEHPQLSLAIQADHNTIMQLRTHRTGISFDVQSMRYSGKRIEMVASGELKPEEVFHVRPPGRYRDRQGDPYEWSAEDVNHFLSIAHASARDYAHLRAKGVAEEHARGVLITSYLQNAVVSANLRTWLHLLDIRLKGDAQHEIRCLMTLIASQVQRWVPEIYSWWHEHRCGKAILAP